MIETFFQMTVPSGEFLADEIGEKLNAIGVKTEWLKCFGNNVLLVELTPKKIQVADALDDYLSDYWGDVLKDIIVDAEYLVIKED